MKWFIPDLLGLRKKDNRRTMVTEIPEEDITEQVEETIAEQENESEETERDGE